MRGTDRRPIFESAFSDSDIQPEVIMTGAAAMANLGKPISAMLDNFLIQHGSTGVLGQLLLGMTPM
jgi:hypothetical protein